MVSSFSHRRRFAMWPSLANGSSIALFCAVVVVPIAGAAVVLQWLCHARPAPRVAVEMRRRSTDRQNDAAGTFVQDSAPEGLQTAPREMPDPDHPMPPTSPITPQLYVHVSLPRLIGDTNGVHQQPPKPCPTTHLRRPTLGCSGGSANERAAPAPAHDVH